jgi:UDP-N-acetylmuramoyl-L-alanyl-D-glutamate--2,6-diaminopimelate ligase
MALLSQLLQKAKISHSTPAADDPEISGISDNSSRVRPGNVFVAVKGYKVDGHDYVGDAIGNGAAAVIAEKPLSVSVPSLVVTDSRIALAKLSNAWYNFPAKDTTMIGVTASNGKTTTSFMIDHILSAYFDTTGLIGTVIVKDGKTAVSADLTTPGSRELFELLASMRLNNCSHVTMEVSSAGLELHRVHGIPFKIATFNNISREHIDFHGTFENYWHQKSRLVRELPETSTAVLNADEPIILALKDQTAADVITYSIKDNSAQIEISDMDLSTGAGIYNYIIPKAIHSRNFTLPSCNLQIRLKVLGLHNVYNSLVAITVAKICGVPDDVIITALSEFGGVERRFQLIYDQEFKIIDDHFANAGNIDITLETLNLMNNRLVMLVAIRGNRGSIVNRENAEAVVRWIPRLPLAELLITDGSEYVEENDKVSDPERAAFLGTLDAAGIKYRHFSRLTDSIRAALEITGSGDVLLLGGPQGMDHAAHLILPLLAARHSDQKQLEILKILDGRVAGTS